MLNFPSNFLSCFLQTSPIIVAEVKNYSCFLNLLSSCSGLSPRKRDIWIWTLCSSSGIKWKGRIFYIIKYWLLFSSEESSHNLWWGAKLRLLVLDCSVFITEILDSAFLHPLSGISFLFRIFLGVFNAITFGFEVEDNKMWGAGGRKERAKRCWSALLPGLTLNLLSSLHFRQWQSQNCRDAATSTEGNVFQTQLFCTALPLLWR